MSITLDNVSTSSSSTSTTSTTGSQSVSQTKQQFLNLLITQLKNQDPLSPADTNQFSAQMMQMGQLEQLFNLNDTMSNFVNVQQGSQLAQYSNMVGKNVLATGDQFQISAASKGQMHFNLPETPSTVNINVFDQYNNLKRQFSANILTSGDQAVAFDGLDQSGNVLPQGYYSYAVEAKDSDAKTIPVTTYSYGAISSVSLQNGTPVFEMGNDDLSVTEIKNIFN